MPKLRGIRNFQIHGHHGGIIYNVKSYITAVVTRTISPQICTKPVGINPQHALAEFCNSAEDIIIHSSYDVLSHSGSKD